jgi:predicted SprT family Zn-dependent metalloprotease
MKKIIEVSPAKGAGKGNSYECEICNEGYSSARWVYDVSYSDDSAAHVCGECLKKARRVKS